MKRTMLTVLSAAVLCSVATAQSPSSLTPTGVQFRVGAFVPADNAMRDLANYFYAAGVDINTGSSLVSKGEGFVAIDAYWRNSNSMGSVVPITYNQRIYTGNSKYGEGRAYLFVGGGIFFFHGPGGNDSKLGGRGGIGFEFNDRLAFEAVGTLTPAADSGVACNGVAIYLGYRFP